MVSEERADGLSRRTLVRVGAGAAVALGLPIRTFAQTATGPGPNFAPDQKYCLVDRMTYGQNDFERYKFNKLGWYDYIEYHLNPSAIDDTYCDNRMNQYTALKLSPKQIKDSYPGSSYDAVSEVLEAQIVRARYSNRQLLEMMVEFWTDHFNVYAWGEQWYETFPRHVYNIRKYALSNFPTLLMQVARSGAMLGYLDNVDNRRNGGNENYARELIELHTMGADTGYAESDVETARRCLSGWNVNQDQDDDEWAQFKFYKDWHVGSGGTFLGDTIAPAYTEDQGIQVLTKLATHPATARHIAEKLCKRFLGDSVSEGAILNVERAFNKTGGDIKTMLRTMLRENAFKIYARPKYKRPFKYVMSALRATNAQIVEGWALRWGFLSQMRQVPFEWAPPNGYPDHVSAWVDNLRPRWQFANDMVLNNAYGVYADIFGQISDRSRDGLVHYCNNALFGMTLSREQAYVLKTYLPGRPTNAQVREIVGLALSLPEFQYC